MGNPYLASKGAKSKHRLTELATAQPRFGSQEMLPVPITAVDDGESKESSLLATSLLRQFPQALLIECMLEKLCATYETDPSKQKELFKALRSYFATFWLLPPAVDFPGMEEIRIRVGSDLNKLFRLAKHQITSSPNHQSLPTAVGPLAVITSPVAERVWTSVDANEHLFTSRYELDFKELEFIAAGGFGVVYKARNILDNNEYAIKKIVIRPRSANKIIREVQLLSLLHHPNIVAYKSAWLEYCSPPILHDIIQRMDGMSLCSHGSVSTVGRAKAQSREQERIITTKIESNYSDSIVFESESFSETSTRQQSTVFQETNIVRIDEAETAISLDIVKGHHWSFNSSQRVSSCAWLLYIQMQLCSQTLRHWLNTRNGRIGSSVVPESIELELSIFRQIVKGIHYIHSSNIIHRDIKPENIFVDEKTHRVQIGDFGLAKLGFSNEPNAGTLSPALPGRTHRHTRGVGTHSYAAPEQLNSQESDVKSDIYSMGVVLLELLVPFQTDMERYKSIERLRNRGRLPDSLVNKRPRLASLILEMISHDRTSRPSAAEILARLDRPGIRSDEPVVTRPQFNEEEERSDSAALPPLVMDGNDGDAHRSIPELLSIIEDLRRQVAEKNLLIERLTNQKR